MNWLKDKTFRILFLIGIALFLGGMPLIFVSGIGSRIGPFISMTGGGVIGIAIALKMQSRSKADRKPHENNLKRKAWKEFLSLVAFSVFGFFIYGFLTYTDVKGIPMLIGCLVMVASMGIGIVISIFNKKKQPIPEFDEREFYLLQRAASIGSSCFMFYAVAAMLIAFSLIGGRGSVPMWSIPAALYTGLLFSGTVQFLVLIHYTKESDE